MYINNNLWRRRPIRRVRLEHKTDWYCDGFSNKTRKTASRAEKRKEAKNKKPSSPRRHDCFRAQRSSVTWNRLRRGRSVGAGGGLRGRCERPLGSARARWWVARRNGRAGRHNGTRLPADDGSWLRPKQLAWYAHVNRVHVVRRPYGPTLSRFNRTVLFRCRRVFFPLLISPVLPATPVLCSAFLSTAQRSDRRVVVSHDNCTLRDCRRRTNE